MFLVRGGVVMTMDAAQPIVEDGAVAVEGTDIVAVGRYPVLAARYPAARVLGSEEEWVLPGFVNGHGHGGLISGWFRQGVQDLPLERWLQRLYNTCLTVGQMPVTYYNTLDLCGQLIRGGVTCTGDFFYGDGGDPTLGVQHGVRAYQEAGLRAALFVGALDQTAVDNGNLEMFFHLLPEDLAQRARELGPIPYNLSQDEYLASWKRGFRAYHDPAGAINICLGPDGPVRCTPEFLRRIKAAAREYGTSIQMHLLETKYQRLYGLKEKGKPLVRTLQELDFLGPEVSFAHGIWVTGEEMEVLAGEGASIVPNPSSNLRLFDGIAPVRQMLARGVNVGLGTDSFGFSDDNDYLEEIRLAMLLQRVPGIEGKTISGQEVLEMATLGGARALGLSDRIGSLQAGKRADLIALSSKRMLSPFMSPLHTPQEILCHRARREDMRFVMVNGRLVMDEGRLTTVDMPAVAVALGEWYARMWGERGERERQIKGVLRKIDPHVNRFFEEYDDGTLQARSMYNAE